MHSRDHHRPRLMPLLLMSDGSLVKTKRFAKPKYVGDPLNIVRIFNEFSVDELVILDIQASKCARLPNLEVLSQISEECRMPLIYGGGIDCLETAKKVFDLGIEKVVINTAAHRSLNLIEDVARFFGSQAIIAAIDVQKNLWGQYRIRNHATQKTLNQTIASWPLKLVENGAGEILLTSIDLEGTWAGFDLKLIQMVSRGVEVPVIAHGGCGCDRHITQAFQWGASAVAIGSKVVFQKKDGAVLLSFPYRSDNHDPTRLGHSESIMNSW